MKLKNVVLSAAFTLLLYFLYVSRYTFDTTEYLLLFFALMVAGGLYAAREWLSSDEVKSDERTKLPAGSAARFTLMASVVVILLTLAYLTWTGRMTSPNGVLAVLLGSISLIYSLTYAYLEKN